MNVSRFLHARLQGSLDPDHAARYHGGGKGKAPPAPDYTGQARAQGDAARQLQTESTFANRPNVTTPWGSETWTPGSTIDPTTGRPVTTWEQNIQLSPEQQEALSSQMRIQAGRSGAAEQLLGQATSAFDKPFNWEGAPEAGTLEGAGYDPTGARDRAESALYQRQVGLLEPGITRSEESRRTRLANMGITPEGGSEAFTRAQEGMDTSRRQAYGDAALNAIIGGGSEATRELGMATGVMDARNRARQQFLAEEAQKRGMPLNELNALLTGQQVSMPDQPGFKAAGTAQAPDLLGAAKAQGQYGLDAAQLKAQSGVNWGQLAGSAALAAGAMMF